MGRAAIVLALACVWAHADAAKTRATVQAEVQIGLCAPQPELEQALGLKSHEPPYDVWQFDDASLGLFDRGLRLRLRMQAAGSVLTLKVANQDCAALAPGLVPGDEGKCEYDVYGAQQAGAVSLNNVLDDRAARELIAGRLPVAQALSPAQVRYLRDVVHFWPLPAGLQGLGPIKALSYRTRRKAYDVDVNVMPDGQRYAEISRKVPVAEAQRAFDALQAYLAGAGIAECTDHTGQAANKLRALLPR